MVNTKFYTFLQFCKTSFKPLLKFKSETTPTIARSATLIEIFIRVNPTAFSFKEIQCPTQNKMPDKSIESKNYFKLGSIPSIPTPLTQNSEADTSKRSDFSLFGTELNYYYLFYYYRNQRAYKSTSL
jgi:hypothetical protein